MASKTIVEKAAEKVGYGLAMAEDMAGSVKTAIVSVAEALKPSPAGKDGVKTAAKKAGKKPAAKKSATKKTVAKKAAVKKPVAKKSATKKTVAKKPVAKKPAAKKAAKKRATKLSRSRR